METTAVIVARGGSKRLPGKNLLDINGETLISRKIRQLLAVSNIDRVVVGSDDADILAVGEASGAEAIQRPDFFCDEAQATANQMIGNMCELIDTDVVVWAHCTNPLLSTGTYERAVNAYVEAGAAGYDSLLSVFALREHLWDASKKPFNYNPYGPVHPPASSLPPLYAQDGGIFIQPHKQMLANRYFFGAVPFLFEIPTDELMDINNPHDFVLAKAYIEKTEGAKP
ncbi:acylneuraminate cytidylyltransferase family protein (plasmid) [Paracoccus liaowanqingii]|uniref:Acylneuraminate cytidylyltransferase family protein n=1 Tax=Paracoccus liaowanqingii TaxID=2560053 RepID=A0A4Y5SQU5_9RHOB|nr:acylneuraminate cytidylyltransferase family protein [Paracoccus liaowanqingii]QDA35719.1 acylneuraminate cytidylyltransferase family protein [Paracoccus liaowanqingii]